MDIVLCFYKILTWDLCESRCIHANDEIICIGLVMGVQGKGPWGESGNDGEKPS